ncbi:VCBS repeat-containing protein [Flavobacteriaceae bacterium GF1]
MNQVFETDSLSLANNYYFYNGAGVTVADFNNDDLLDIYFTGNHVPSKLYLNKGNLKFQDITESAGLVHQYWASGSTFVDINADGLQDIYVCTVGKGEPNLLYINQGKDEKGIPTFKEMASEYGLADETISTQAVFFDFDRDNDLDVFIAVNSQLMNDRNTTRPRNLEMYRYTRDKFYKNNGDGTFTDVSESVGMINEGYSLGVAISDINNDGWPDIYVANDFISNDLLYINTGEGTFEEKAMEYLRHSSYNGMGVDIADINSDGLMDITVMDMLPQSNSRQKLMQAPLNYDLFEYRTDLGYIPQNVRNTLQMHAGFDEKGEPQFSEIGTMSGLYATDWSWAPIWADFDNSGSLDLFITNGYYKDLTDLDFALGVKEKLRFGTQDHNIAYQKETLNKLRQIKEPNFIYKNKGRLILEDASKAWGITEPSFSHGAAFADLDNDGDLEIIVNNLGQESFLYENTNPHGESTSAANFIKIKLKGFEKNTNGLGAKLKIHYGDKTQTYYHSHVRGYLSSMGHIIHMGLGNTSKIDSIVIAWPDGNYQLIRDVKVNETLQITYRPSNRAPLSKPTETIFTKVSDTLGLSFRHSENNFIDFKSDPLFLKMYSREGPAMTVGDINGDKEDDIIIGGSSGFHPTVFRQIDGKFEKDTLIGDDPIYEDGGLLLFDADNDNDNDLYIVSGGTEHANDETYYQDRLYLNENGSFIRSDNLPQLPSSGGPVKGADYDRDGDIDLFIGGKIVPGAYPTAPKSTLLRNDNGVFVDATPNALNEIGMISDALWTDFNNDGWVDLIAVGEWTEIQFFKNHKGTLQPYKETDLTDTQGWWNSIASADFDSDGDMDYLIGNFGLNSYIKASRQRPVRLYAGDFDENDKIDPLLSHYMINDEGEYEEFPLHARDALIDQIIAYKKRFKTYLSFSQATFDEVLKEGDRKRSMEILKASILTTSYLENLGDGIFKLSALPMECQVSPVFGMLVQDVDFDGYLDVIVSGNLNSAEALFGNYDASNGVFLKNDGTGKFLSRSAMKTGLYLNEDQKSIANAIISGESILLAAANSGDLKVYKHAQNTSENRDIVNLLPLDAYADVKFSDGRKSRYEFYYGNTYLSQSPRKLLVHPDMEEIIIYDTTGEARTVLQPQTQ